MTHRIEATPTESLQFFVERVVMGVLAAKAPVVAVFDGTEFIVWPSLEAQAAETWQAKRTK